MTTYIPFQTTLTEGQKKKLISAKKNGKSITININNNMGPDVLLLTQTQLKRLQKKIPARITLSETQMSNQTGGFLSAILPFVTKTILPALGTLGLSAASGAISGATNKATRGGGVFRTGDGIFPVMMDKKSVKKVLETVEKLENIGLIEKGSLDRSMKEIKEQKGGFIGTLLAGLAGSLLPALFGQGGSGLLGRALGLPNNKIPILGDIPIIGNIF